MPQSDEEILVNSLVAAATDLEYARMTLERISNDPEMNKDKHAMAYWSREESQCKKSLQSAKENLLFTFEPEPH